MILSKNNSIKVVDLYFTSHNIRFADGLVYGTVIKSFSSGKMLSQLETKRKAWNDVAK